jgi:hypothetical protein
MVQAYTQRMKTEKVPSVNPRTGLPIQVSVLSVYCEDIDLYDQVRGFDYYPPPF